MFLLTTGNDVTAKLALPFYIAFLVAAIIGGIYMLIYRRNLNKALKQNNGRHVSLPDVRSIAIFLLVALLFFGIFSTKSTIIKMQEEMNDEFMFLHDRINHLESNSYSIERKLNELLEANRVVDTVNYSVESYDLDNKKVTYSIEVTLKENNANTNVFLTVKDKVIDCSYVENGKYVGKLEIGIFEIVEDPILVEVGANGVTTSVEEYYYGFFDGWKQCLSTVMIEFNESFSVDSDHKIDFVDNVKVIFNNKEDCYFKEAHLEIDEAGEELVIKDFGYRMGEAEYSINLDRHLPNIYSDTQVDVYIVAVDNLGYTHRILINEWRGEMLNTYDYPEYVFDKDGNQLTQ